VVAVLLYLIIPNVPIQIPSTPVTTVPSQPQPLQAVSRNLVDPNTAQPDDTISTKPTADTAQHPTEQKQETVEPTLNPATTTGDVIPIPSPAPPAPTEINPISSVVPSQLEESLGKDVTSVAKVPDTTIAPNAPDTSPKLSANPPSAPKRYTNIPENAHPISSGTGWECDRGFARSGTNCMSVRIPSNASLNAYGNDWQCNRGFFRSGGGCAPVQIPPDAGLNVYGNDWQCNRGFFRSGGGCAPVQIPPNAGLNVYGNDWQCNRGFFRSGGGCLEVRIPPNASLNVYGNGWQCNRGFTRYGDSCVRGRP